MNNLLKFRAKDIPKNGMIAVLHKFHGELEGHALELWFDHDAESKFSIRRRYPDGSCYDTIIEFVLGLVTEDIGFVVYTIDNKLRISFTNHMNRIYGGNILKAIKYEIARECLKIQSQQQQQQQ